MMNQDLRFFLEESWEYSERVRLLNTVPTQQFIRLLLPKMLVRKKGVIINISSMAERVAMHFPAYCMQKVAVSRLSDVLVSSSSLSVRTSLHLLCIQQKKKGV